jgi:flagellar hook-associated protein 3 FlgL
MSISQNYIFNKLSNNNYKIKSELANNQDLLSKKHAASSISELSKIKQGGTVLLSYSEIANIQNYSDNNQILQSKLLAVDQTLEHVLEVANDLKSNLNLLRSSATDSSNFNGYAKSQLKYLEGLLNRSHAGKYLFSGTSTDITPVVNIDKVSNIMDNIVTANYYVGGKQDEYSKIDDNTKLNYGIKADNDAFKDLISSFHYGLKSIQGPELNNDILDNALDKINSSLKSIISMRTKLGHNLQSINRVESINGKLKQAIENQVDTIMGVDLADVTVKINSQNMQLIASYKSINKLQSMSLANYI